MNNIKETVAKNLLYYRKQKKLSQKDLADKIGVKHNTISSWENCTNTIDIDSLYQISKIFQISINELFGVSSESVNKETILNTTEQTLLTNYRTLNSEGQEKAATYVEDLTGNPKYTISERKVGIPKNAKEILERHLSAMENTAQIAAKGEGVHSATASKVTPERMEEIEKLSQQFNKE